jgi:hypothetical protein
LLSRLIEMVEAEPLSIRASIISSITTWIHVPAALRLSLRQAVPESWKILKLADTKAHIENIARWLAE